METLVTLKVSVVLCPIMTETDTAIRIKEKAHGLFMQYGLRSVSMDDIANGLGISKKTIYQYYSDKDELVDAVVDSEITRNEGICDFDRSASLNAIHEIFLAMDMVMEMFATMNPAVLFDMQKYHPKAFLKFLKHKDDYLYGVIRENLVRGIKEELYRPEINIDIISRFRVESMLLPFDHNFHTKVKQPMALVEQEFILHYIFGVASPKGYKLIVKYQQERLNKISNDAKK